jgi:uncharacterized protein (TIGR02145 family)
MRKSGTYGFWLVAGLMAAGAILQTCRKDPSAWDPEASLLIKPDSGLTTQTFNLQVAVDNLPASQPTFYIRWNFDGDSSWNEPFTSEHQANWRFYQAGIHQVKAEILTQDGKRVNLQKEVSVAQGYSAPHVSFKIDPPVGNYLTTFTFDAGTTFDDEDQASTLRFRWDFENDGHWNTDTNNNPVAKYKFPRSGIYNVKVQVTDPTGRAANLTKELVVNRHDDGILPGFTWSPADGTVKDTFLLDASSTHHATDPERYFTYTWDVNAELTYGPFAGPVFSHVFWSSGSKTVTLTVTDQYGLSNSIDKEIFVIKENKPPTPRIQVATPFGNITTNFYLSAWPSTDDVTAPSQLLIRWDFDGDGNWDTSWSYEKELFHQFPDPGEYWCRVEAEDEGGERAIAKIRILVSPYAIETGFILDRRDGNYYGTVRIGNQWWMSDNLDYRTNPKMNIPMLQKCYQGSNTMCDQYGSLYQGRRAVNYVEAGNRICPDGWRLPSREDWEELGAHVPSTGGRDALLVGGSTGFNARYTGSGFYVTNFLPTGGVSYTFYFSGLFEEVKYLSTTTRPYQTEFASQFYMGVMRNWDAIDLRWGNINGYFYVRCIKND